MKQQKFNSKFNITSVKVLMSVRDVNKEGRLPSIELLYLILRGSSQAKEFQMVPTYSILVSIRKRTISTVIKHLIELGYLKTLLSSEYESTYYEITLLGEETLNKYLSYHKVNLTKSKTNECPLYLTKK